MNGSIGRKIKSAALQQHPEYKKSTANEKVTVCYSSNSYDDVLNMARPTIVYDAKKSSGTNWTKTYKRIKELEIQYDIDLDEEHNDTGFALFFCSRLCKSIKNNHELFNKQKMVSEGDFLMKLWSLGLKGDTHLNNEIEEPGTLKFDLRVSNEASMAEFAKSSPGYPKYSSHRSKP